MASEVNQGAARLARPARAGGPKRAARKPGARVLAAVPAAYYSRIEEYARKIRATADVSDIVTILDEALSETRALHTANEIALARQQVVLAEQRIEHLKSELELVNQLVREDQLTGALNRRGLDDAMAREVARANRAGTPFCIALIDLDNFKKINDAFGHPVGDLVLVHLVAIIRETIRANDMIGRCGGEEFLLLLPDSCLEEAVAVIGRLQRKLAAKPMPWAREQLQVTFSAGIAAHAAGDAVDILIQRADQALYQAKHAGKNRLSVAA